MQVPRPRGRRPAGLRVVRGKNLVIPDLDLQVPAGQVVGLLGPSGSGKTTLMRAIVGAQIVAGGTVEVLGEPAGRTCGTPPRSCTSTTRP